MPTCQSPIVADSQSTDDDLQSLEWLPNFDISRITNFLDSSEIDANCDSPKNDVSSSEKQRKSLQCTFSCMIFRAIEESQHRALPLQSIYAWIEERYPCLQESGSQWKNSVRHSLSFNQCFIRLRLGPQGTHNTSCFSSWWTVHPDFRNAYRRSVLADGSEHSCLPRRVCGPGIKKDVVTRLSTSEHELTLLANDIEAAATILALKEPLGASNRGRLESKKKKKSLRPTGRRKRKLEPEYVVSHGMAEDHRYVSENSKRNFSISSIIGPVPASSSKRVADASVQVCASDFDHVQNDAFKRITRKSGTFKSVAAVSSKKFKK